MAHTIAKRWLTKREPYDYHTKHSITGLMIGLFFFSQHHPVIKPTGKVAEMQKTQWGLQEKVKEVLPKLPENFQQLQPQTYKHKPIVYTHNI